MPKHHETKPLPVHFRQRPMNLPFYNLREQPFAVSPNPRFIYSSQSHRAALASLTCAIDNDLGFAALIAEPGMGKTTLLFRLLETLGNTALTAFLFETQCSSNALLRYLLQELNASTNDRDPVALREQLQQVLLRAARSGRRV